MHPLRFPVFICAVILLMPVMVPLTLLLMVGSVAEALRRPFSRHVLFPLIRWTNKA